LTHSLNYSGAAKTPSADIIIGDSAVDTDIDDLKIYNRALSSQEVQDIYNNTTSGNLKAYYKFDEGSGTTTADSSGNGYDGTINGATWVTGKIGDGLSFDGFGNNVTIPLMNYDEISISAWFYKSVNDTTNADAIFGGWKWNSDAQLQEGYDLRFYQASPDTLQFVLVTQDVSGSKTMKIARYNLVNSVSIWYHVAGTYNKTSGEQKLYADGQLVDTQTHPADNTIVPLTFYSDMRIGYSRVNNGYFNGTIDDVRLYNHTLSDQEILDLFNGGTSVGQ